MLSSYMVDVSFNNKRGSAMMNQTKISWTDATWNPTHGCSRVSEGCRNCYAERLSLKMGFTKLEWTARNAASNIKLQEHKLRDPYKLKKPSLVFVNSMSDLFHEDIPDEYIARVFEVMNDLGQHEFQVLTKRPERAAKWEGPWSSNIWLGCSVEDKKATKRLDYIRKSPAHIKFVSFEPLLESLGNVNLEGFDWAIVGGESGPGFRKMPHAWAREIRDRCKYQDVAYFFKQSAAYRTEMGTSLLHENGKFYKWEQFPYTKRLPVVADPHKYIYE